MAANSGFQISLDVRGWPVLVIGGNEEAADKVQRLLDAGAKVTVVSPTLHEILRKLAASAKIIHRGRHFRANDLESVILVLNTLREDRELAHSLIRLAREQKFLLWSVDQPDVSNVVMPAVVSSGHVRVAISSSGQAPALSGFMKEDLERILDGEFAAFVDWLAQLPREQKFLLWSVDQPDVSNVVMPAVVSSGHVRVAISSSGQAPALSGFMKEDLERILDGEFAAFVDWLAQLREQAKANEPDAEKRRALLREALDGFRLLGKVQYPKVWQEQRASQQAPAAPASTT